MHNCSTKSLLKMREYGFTTFSGIPNITYRGFKDGKPVLDFTAADAQMQQAKALGFLAVNSYGAGISGINAYYRDVDRAKEAGFTGADYYSQFIKAVYSAVQQHAVEQGWLPVYWNLGDEPMGDDLTHAITNADGLSPGLSAGTALLHRRHQLRRQIGQRSPFRLRQIA